MRTTSSVRAAILGLALAASAVPAGAAQFHFGFGTDGFGFRRPLICIELTDRQIRNAVRDQGYSNIYLNASRFVPPVPTGCICCVSRPAPAPSSAASGFAPHELKPVPSSVRSFPRAGGERIVLDHPV